MINDTLTNLNVRPDSLKDKFWFKGSKKNTAIEDFCCNALYMLYDHKNIVWSNQQTICLEYLSIVDCCRCQYFIYGPVRMILIEDE